LILRNTGNPSKNDYRIQETAMKEAAVVVVAMVTAVNKFRSC
jgi:hypothetical protein